MHKHVKLVLIAVVLVSLLGTAGALTISKAFTG